MKSLLLGCSLFIPFFASAQSQISLKVKDKGEGETLPAVTVLADSVFAATTDNAGVANVSLSDGRHLLSFLMTGYRRYDTVITVPGPARIDIQLVFEEKGLEEVTIVASTRNNQNIENSPLKVEVLGPEEMSEEASIKPGNIASILGDVSGIQIQQTSATTGNSNVRIQGLEGRYTQILRDGMPLYDGFSGSFGILTIPPLDLRQIELIKGSASTLYGGGAIGGLINLISKRPTYDQTLDALLNYTTLKEFNANLFTSKRNDKVGYTLFAGYNRQDAVDVNGDGFSDVPNSQSVIVHPRLFWYPNSKTMISVGYSGAFDTRDGGDMKVLEGDGDNVHRYHELNISQRNTGEYIVEHTSDKGARYTFKGTASDFNREQDSYNNVQGRQISYYSEASAMFPFKEDNLVAGVNIVGDDYKTIKPAFASLQSFSNFTAGAFGQYSKHIKEHTIIEGGIRFDHHNRYGLLVLPRIAAFHRFSEAWATRVGFGMGYKTPNPLVQQNIDYSPLVLLPLSDAVKPEISYGYNAEVNYTHKWGDGAKLFINQAFFLTQVQRPIMFESGMYGGVVLVNAKYPLLSAGSDTYVKLDIHHWELYAGYTYTEPRNDNLMSISQGYIPLTPKHRFAFVLAKEIGEEWRIGIEGSYTGFQYRYDGTTTPGYWFLAAMIQRSIGKHVILVLNGENLLDYRMSKVESLYTGSVSDPVFKPLWAPIDGRAINFSVRYKL